MLILSLLHTCMPMYVCVLYEFLDTYLKFVLIVNLYVPVHILGVVVYVHVKRG